MYTPLKDGFYTELAQARQAAPLAALNNATGRDVEACLNRQYLQAKDLLVLLSPVALPYLEHMAQRAHHETLRVFGKSVQLFTPLYLANYCTNRCVYCGFSAKRGIARAMLGPEEVEAEAKSIAATGLRKILALTGDDPKRTGPAYLASCLRILARHFSSVGVEVPSMTVEEYAMQVEAGADSMTMFQETYNEERYAALHPAGPKRDFGFRLDAPQRALTGGMRAVNLGPLLGLDDWRLDLYYTALHAFFLGRRWPEAEISVSLPRMRTHTEGGEVKFDPLDVNDTHFVQALVALRCVLPQVGITMSSRESAWLRDRLIPLGVTRVSAGVVTSVGGHVANATPTEAEQEAKPQFDISDDRSVDEMAAALRRAGYQPVFADWLLPGLGASNLTGGVERALAK